MKFPDLAPVTFLVWDHTKGHIYSHNLLDNFETLRARTFETCYNIPLEMLAAT